MTEQAKQTIMEAVLTSYFSERTEYVFANAIPTEQELREIFNETMLEGGEELGAELKMILPLQDGLEIAGLTYGEPFSVQIVTGEHSSLW